MGTIMTYKDDDPSGYATKLTPRDSQCLVLVDNRSTSMISCGSDGR